MTDVSILGGKVSVSNFASSNVQNKPLDQNGVPILNWQTRYVRVENIRLRSNQSFTIDTGLSDEIDIVGAYIFFKGQNGLYPIYWNEPIGVIVFPNTITLSYHAKWRTIKQDGNAHLKISFPNSSFFFNSQFNAAKVFVRIDYLM